MPRARGPRVDTGSRICAVRVQAQRGEKERRGASGVSRRSCSSGAASRGRARVLGPGLCSRPACSCTSRRFDSCCVGGSWPGGACARARERVPSRGACRPWARDRRMRGTSRTAATSLRRAPASRPSRGGPAQRPMGEHAPFEVVSEEEREAVALLDRARDERLDEVKLPRGSGDSPACAHRCDQRGLARVCAHSSRSLARPL